MACRSIIIKYCLALADRVTEGRCNDCWGEGAGDCSWHRKCKEDNLRERQPVAELIYLASPYSHPDPAMRELRYKQACEVAALLMRDGHLVYSPIVHSHPLTAYGLPADWDYWRRLDEEMLRRCDALAVLRLPGWEQSVGVQAELALARELGLKISPIIPGRAVVVECEAYRQETQVEEVD